MRCLLLYCLILFVCVSLQLRVLRGIQLHRPGRMAAWQLLPTQAGYLPEDREVLQLREDHGAVQLL